MFSVHQVWPKPSCKAQWKGKKTRQVEEEMGRQHQGMDRPGVRQVPEGSGEQGKWRRLFAESFVVPQRPSRWRDWWGGGGGQTTVRHIPRHCSWWLRTGNRYTHPWTLLVMAEGRQPSDTSLDSAYDGWGQTTVRHSPGHWALRDGWGQTTVKHIPEHCSWRLGTNNR